MALHTFHSRRIIDIHNALSFSNVRIGTFLRKLPIGSKENEIKSNGLEACQLATVSRVIESCQRYLGPKADKTDRES